MQTLLRLARMRPQCLDADFLLGKLVGIADESVDDDASPAVVDTQLTEIAADQRATRRAATVDHQSLPFARCFEQRAPQRVVLAYLAGQHRAMTHSVAAKVTTHRTGALRVGTCVGQVGARHNTRLNPSHKCAPANP